MTVYLVRRDDGDIVGMLTDENLADDVDGSEVYFGTYDSHEYEIEEAPNDDVF